MKTKTVDVAKMPHNVLKDFLDGVLTFENAYAMYPGTDCTVTEEQEKKEEGQNEGR
jgi:hypothetical protein